ncbi:hypothetical protein VH86_03985 [Pantoea sp. BL1]|uniref:hypothetical protein n=1 Tax=Pantoea sp. BL1 TaxID=1628190 RepID=UPI0005F7C566|nr:hypothetical protein [Pantoea sp. BL1]KJV49652.1 hypothetical protein VH86_03985 [Pantoea sp. BL1]
MNREEMRKAIDENDEVHLELSGNQVAALLEEIQSSLSNGTESAVKAVMKISNDEPGIISYEIVTEKGQN